MGRKRTQSIREKRDEHEAAERRRRADEGLDDEDEYDEDEDEEEEDEDLDDEDLGEDEEEPKKKKPKPKKKAAPKTTKTRRSRTAKVQRMRVVWGVFNNSHTCVATYEYKKKKEAEQHAAKLTAAKPNNVHFIQPVKEPMEEPKAETAKGK